MSYQRSFALFATVLFLTSVMLLLPGQSSAQTQKPSATNNNPTVPARPYADYKGVLLGMTMAEVRSKLGTPTFSDSEMDFFAVSATETAQIAYDSAGKAKVISIDYQNGAGAPDPEAVVGASLEQRDNGTQYRQIRYERLGFWVSYSRTASPVDIVTITIQKL